MIAHGRLVHKRGAGEKEVPSLPDLLCDFCFATLSPISETAIHALPHHSFMPLLFAGEVERSTPGIADAVVDADTIAVARSQQRQPARKIRFRKLRSYGSNTL